MKLKTIVGYKELDEISLNLVWTVQCTARSYIGKVYHHFSYKSGYFINDYKKLFKNNFVLHNHCHKNISKCYTILYKNNFNNIKKK